MICSNLQFLINAADKGGQILNLDTENMVVTMVAPRG
jgi:hypothetical protein